MVVVDPQLVQVVKVAVELQIMVLVVMEPMVLVVAVVLAYH